MISGAIAVDISFDGVGGDSIQRKRVGDTRTDLVLNATVASSSSYARRIAADHESQVKLTI